MSRRNHAFTLIELLVVISIIAILVGLSFPVYNSILESGKRKTAAAQIRLIELKLNDFRLENGFLPPATFVGGAPPASSGEAGEYDADPKDPAYLRSARVLFLALTGRTTFDDGADSLGKSYYEPRPADIGAPAEASDAIDSSVRSTYRDHSFDSGSYLIDPWGNPYGYYYDPENGDWKSYRSPSTHDIWSTGKSTDSDAANRSKWITSWEDAGG